MGKSFNYSCMDCKKKVKYSLLRLLIKFVIRLVHNLVKAEVRLSPIKKPLLPFIMEEAIKINKPTLAGFLIAP